MSAYVLPVALLGAVFFVLSLPGLLAGNGPRITQVVSVLCFSLAFVLSLVH